MVPVRIGWTRGIVKARADVSSSARPYAVHPVDDGEPMPYSGCIDEDCLVVHGGPWRRLRPGRAIGEAARAPATKDVDMEITVNP
jgi:hypothetical protein